MLRESESEKVERPRCRVVGRASNNANANGGLVYSNANNVSTNSNTNNGSRLTLRRKMPLWTNISEALHGHGLATASSEGREPRQPSPTVSQKEYIWKKAGT